MFDGDKAATATNRMWLRLARLLDKKVDAEMADGHQQTALRTARMAEACYWQATGESDCSNLKDII